MSHITMAQFCDRFPALILDGRGLPKKALDLNMLVLSATLGIAADRPYAEGEINAELQQWVLDFGRGFELDHVTLRRLLIDEKYISRDAGGKSYRLEAASLHYTYDASIRGLDLQTLVAQARDEREKRKQQFLKQSRQ